MYPNTTQRSKEFHNSGRKKDFIVPLLPKRRTLQKMTTIQVIENQNGTNSGNKMADLHY